MLWWLLLLFESAGRGEEAFDLDVADLDLANRQARGLSGWRACSP